MVAQRLPIDAGTRFLAADEVAQLLAADAVRGALAVTQAGGGQALPLGGVAEAPRTMGHGITAVLVAAVAALLGLIGVVLQPGEVRFAGVRERLLDIRQQVLLVLLDGQE